MTITKQNIKELFSIQWAYKSSYDAKLQNRTSETNDWCLINWVLPLISSPAWCSYSRGYFAKAKIEMFSVRGVCQSGVLVSLLILKKMCGFFEVISSGCDRSANEQHFHWTEERFWTHADKSAMCCAYQCILSNKKAPSLRCPSLCAVVAVWGYRASINERLISLH